MDLIAVKAFLRSRKIVPLRDLAVHFNVDARAVEPLLETWMRKGKVRKIAGATSACKGCCQCDPATITSYEWLED